MNDEALVRLAAHIGAGTARTAKQAHTGLRYDDTLLSDSRRPARPTQHAARSAPPASKPPDRPWQRPPAGRPAIRSRIERDRPVAAALALAAPCDPQRASTPCAGDFGPSHRFPSLCRRSACDLSQPNSPGSRSPTASGDRIRQCSTLQRSPIVTPRVDEPFSARRREAVRSFRDCPGGRLAAETIQLLPDRSALRRAASPGGASSPAPRPFNPQSDRSNSELPNTKQSPDARHPVDDRLGGYCTLIDLVGGGGSFVYL